MVKNTCYMVLDQLGGICVHSSESSSSSSSSSNSGIGNRSIAATPVIWDNSEKFKNFSQVKLFKIYSRLY